MNIISIYQYCGSWIAAATKGDDAPQLERFYTVPILGNTAEPKFNIIECADTQCNILKFYQK